MIPARAPPASRIVKPIRQNCLIIAKCAARRAAGSAAAVRSGAVRSAAAAWASKGVGLAVGEGVRCNRPLVWVVMVISKILRFQPGRQAERRLQRRVLLPFSMVPVSVH